MLKSADVVDLLYPEPDDISVYLLNLSVIFLLLFDAALRSSVWRALVAGLGEEGDSIGVVLLWYRPYLRRCTCHLRVGTFGRSRVSRSWGMRSCS